MGFEILLPVIINGDQNDQNSRRVLNILHAQREVPNTAFLPLDAEKLLTWWKGHTCLNCLVGLEKIFVNGRNFYIKSHTHKQLLTTIYSHKLKSIEDLDRVAHYHPLIYICNGAFSNSGKKLHTVFGHTYTST